MHTNASRKRDMEYMSEGLSSLLKSISTPRSIKKGEYVFQEGQESKNLFLIESGIIQVSKLTMDGKELTMRISKQNDLIGELPLFSEETPYMLSAKALEDSDVLVIQSMALEKELMKNAELAVEIMKWLTNQLRINQSKIRDLIMNGKKGAFYSTLIRISNSYGRPTEDGIYLTIHLTNQEFASFCATTRESINRMFSELKKNNVVDMDEDGMVLIKDLSYLRREIGCEHCPIAICTID